VQVAGLGLGGVGADGPIVRAEGSMGELAMGTRIEATAYVMPVWKGKCFSLRFTYTSCLSNTDNQYSFIKFRYILQI